MAAMPSRTAAANSVNFGTQTAQLQQNGVDINALIASMVSRDSWTYYYTLNIPVATVVNSNYNLFNAVAGSIDPYNTGTSLTKVQTNMPSICSQGFSAPRDLVLDSIGFSFSSATTLSDQNNFITNSYFEFKILDKIFFEGPITLHPSGTGVYGFTSATNQGVFQNGLPEVKNRKRFGQFAKYLAPLMQWSLVIYFPNSTNQFTTQASGVGGNGISLRVDLNGLTDRPVQ